VLWLINKTTYSICECSFQGSSEGIVTNEDGKFYLESAKTYVTLLISSLGFSEKEITLDKAVNYNFKIQLSEAESLNDSCFLLVKLLKKTILH
jgi:hypothetical protein